MRWWLPSAWRGLWLLSPPVSQFADLPVQKISAGWVGIFWAWVSLLLACATCSDTSWAEHHSVHPSRLDQVRDESYCDQVPRDRHNEATAVATRTLAETGIQVRRTQSHVSSIHNFCPRTGRRSSAALYAKLARWVRRVRRTRWMRLTWRVWRMQWTWRTQWARWTQWMRLTVGSPGCSGRGRLGVGAADTVDMADVLDMAEYSKGARGYGKGP